MMNKQRGAVLITVLVIVFIVMAIVSNLAVSNFRVIKRLTNQKIQSQAYAILTAAVSFGRAGLGTSAATSPTDSLTDIWAQPLPKASVMDDIEMGGYITDAQSKFNINDLVTNGNINPNVLNQFTLLLSNLNLPQGIASNIAYYMVSPSNQGDIMNQYTMGTPAYRPAGRQLIDLSELLLVKGVQSSWLYKLNQYVTVIPPTNFNYAFGQNESSTNESGVASNKPPVPANAPASSYGTGLQVNVNTASAEVISAKSGIPLQVAQRMVATRQSKVFASTGDITNFLTSNGVILSQTGSQGQEQKINPATLSVTSSYFTIHAVVDSGSDEFRWIALVYRQNRSGQWPRILWQHPE